MNVTKSATMAWVYKVFRGVFRARNPVAPVEIAKRW